MQKHLLGRMAVKHLTIYSMITIVSVPGDISLSRNDILFKVRATDGSGNPYGPVPAMSVWEMNGSGIMATETIIINYTNSDGVLTSLTFEAVDNPATDLQVKAYPSTGPFPLITDHYNDVLTKIAAHPDLAPYLTVYGMFGITFEIIAQAKSTDSAISISWDVTGVGNAVGATDHPASDSTAPAGYEVVMEVLFESEYNSGNFTPVTTLEASPGEGGYVYFNIKDVIDDELTSSFTTPPIPSFGSTDPYVANTLRRFYVRIRENWDGISTPDNDWNTLSTKLVLCGGIAQNLFADYGFFSSLSETNSILSWYPQGKTISPDQPEYLPWYNYTGVQKLAFIRVTKINTATGAETTENVYENTGGLPVEENEVGVFPVGFEQMGLSGDIHKYKVQVIATGPSGEEELSQARTYMVDHAYYQQKRYLMYLNGFCFPETIRCPGEHTTELEVNRLEASHVLSPDYSVLAEEVTQHKQAFVNYFTYRTGYLREVDMHALQELLIYGKLYEIYDTGYIPLRLKVKKFLINNTRQHLRSYALLASPRMQQRNYSNINLPLEAEQTGWATSWGDFWKTVYGTNWEIA